MSLPDMRASYGHSYLYSNAYPPIGYDVFTGKKCPAGNAGQNTYK